MDGPGALDGGAGDLPIDARRARPITRDAHADLATPICAPGLIFSVLGMDRRQTVRSGLIWRASDGGLNFRERPAPKAYINTSQNIL